MKRRLETSDGFYDARTSSNPEKLKDHVEELADKPITYIDNDYLNLLRLLTGQSADRQTTDHTEGDRSGGETLSLICEGQQPKLRKISDLQNDDGVDMQQNRSQYAVLVANTRSLEDEDGCQNPLCSNDDQRSQRQRLSDGLGDKQAAHRHVRKSA